MAGAPVLQEMKRIRQPVGNVRTAAFTARLCPVARLPTDYTARIIPNYAGVAVPLEDARILWQR